MPHQCVRCSKMYPDGAQEILKGCPCGARLFFFIRPEKLEAVKKELPTELPAEQKKQIEQDVLKLVGAKEDKPIVLDFESIHVVQPGKYELDLVKLFNDSPLIFKLEDGKYIIDIAESFQRLKKKEK